MGKIEINLNMKYPSGENMKLREIEETIKDCIDSIHAIEFGLRDYKNVEEAEYIKSDLIELMDISKILMDCFGLSETDKSRETKILYAQERGDEFAIAIEFNGKKFDGYLRIVEEVDKI